MSEADRICKHHGALRCSECFEVNELNKELEVLRGQLKDADELLRERFMDREHYNQVSWETRVRKYQAKYKSTTCEELTSKK